MSKRKARPPSSRAERRERERGLVKLTRERERLASLEPGGSADRPILLESASQVEPHARAMTCPRCDGALRVEEHRAETIGDARLRVAGARCAACGARREIWFRLQLPS